MPNHTRATVTAALNQAGLPCEQHELGLAAYAPDPTAYARALQACDPEPFSTETFPTRTVCHGYANCCACPDCTTRANARLHIVTMGTPTPEQHPDCTGTMTCTCGGCQAERAAVLRRGPQGEGNASPFKHAA